MNKKGQIGSTLTWIVAFIIIFVIMLMFIAVTLALAKVKGFSGTEKAQYVMSYSSGPQFYSSFMVFLNSPLENGLTIAGILRSSDEPNKTLEDIFKRECQKYLVSNFPTDEYSGSFIALYNFSEGKQNILWKYYCSNSATVVTSTGVVGSTASPQIASYSINVPIYPNKRITLSLS